MWLLYLLFWTAVRASNPLYGKLGGVAVLTPDHVVGHITDITWKHGSVVAMEWHGSGNPLSHGSFKGRGSLNIRTGEMTITELTVAHRGIYTATINTNLTSQTELRVISPVPKPTISVKCETKTTCTFNCTAKVKGAEPVTFWWKADFRRWTSTSRQTQITKEDKEEWFSCIVENPVSSHSSDEIFNPFLPSSKTWIYILVAVILAVGIFGFLGYKYKTK